MGSSTDLRGVMGTWVTWITGRGGGVTWVWEGMGWGEHMGRRELTCHGRLYLMPDGPLRPPPAEGLVPGGALTRPKAAGYVAAAAAAERVCCTAADLA